MIQIISARRERFELPYLSARFWRPLISPMNAAVYAVRMGFEPMFSSVTGKQGRPDSPNEPFCGQGWVRTNYQRLNRPLLFLQ